MMAVVAVPVVLNSIGVYGSLSRAHIEHALASDLNVVSKAADIDVRLSVQAGIVADLDRRIGQVDAPWISRSAAAAPSPTSNARSARTSSLAAPQRPGSKFNLKVEKAAVDGERKAVEADLGPVRYLATLLSSCCSRPRRIGGARERS